MDCQLLCRYVHAVLPADIVNIIAMMHLNIYVVRMSAIHKRIRLIGRLDLVRLITQNAITPSNITRAFFSELYIKSSTIRGYFDNKTQKYGKPYPIADDDRHRIDLGNRAHHTFEVIIRVNKKYYNVIRDIHCIFKQFHAIPYV